MTDSHNDFFIKNLVVILAEQRALVAVTQPFAAEKVTVSGLGTQTAPAGSNPVPTTTAAVSSFLGLSPARPVDDEALAAAVAAANDAVWTWRQDLDDPSAEGTVWPPRVDFAATIEAARLYGRRGSVQGVAAFQDTGVSFLPSLDPEVKSLLEIGQFQPSVVA